MKKILSLVSAALLSTSAFSADLIRPEGLFTYNGVKISQVKDIELVPVQNRARFKELVAEGFGCPLTDRFYRCSKFIKDVVLPGHIEREMEGRYSWRTFQFIRSPFSPELINDAESFAEYRVLDTVTYGDETVTEYNYYHLFGQNNVHKAIMSFEENPQWPVFESEKSIYTSAQKTVTFNQFKSRVFELSVTFTKR